MIETSPLLAGTPNLRHGFATRLGGVSRGAHATLNLDRSVEDDPPAVEENRRRFAELCGFGGARVVQALQVHGTRVLQVERHPDPEARLEEADALLSWAPGVPVGVRTADCVPVLVAGLTDLSARAVGAVHAGWRGATAGILGEVLRAFAARGFPAGALRFALGPAISLPRFEVGEEVVEAARRSLGGGEPPLERGARGRWHLDLRGLLLRQLDQQGVAPAQIELVGGCTFSAPSLYYSHRRDQGRTGRHLSAIGFLEPAG